MSLHLQLSGDAEPQRITKAIDVRVYVGVYETRQQRATLGVDHGCSRWHCITNGLNRRAADGDILTAKDAFTVENTRIADRGSHRLIHHTHLQTLSNERYCIMIAVRGVVMNEVVRAILGRRSVRSFKDGQVRGEDLDMILQCACYAPSAMNSQNWHFTAIRDAAVIGKVNGWIVSEIKESGNPSLEGILERSNGNVFRNAPCVVIVSTERADRFGVINASAAMQNMLLAAHSLGVGSCWIGTVGILGTSKRMDHYASELKLPQGYAPSFGVTLGYSASETQEAPPRKSDAVTIL